MQLLYLQTNPRACSVCLAENTADGKMCSSRFFMYNTSRVSSLLRTACRRITEKLDRWAVHTPIWTRRHHNLCSYRRHLINTKMKVRLSKENDAATTYVRGPNGMSTPCACIDKCSNIARIAGHGAHDAQEARGNYGLYPCRGAQMLGCYLCGMTLVCAQPEEFHCNTREVARSNLLYPGMLQHTNSLKK
jgi:hypothetical protein